MTGRVDILSEDIAHILRKLAVFADQRMSEMIPRGWLVDEPSLVNEVAAKFPSEQTAAPILDNNAPVPSPQYVELRMQHCLQMIAEIMQIMCKWCPALLIDHIKLLEKAEDINNKVITAWPANTETTTFEQATPLRNKLAILHSLIPLIQSSINIFYFDTAPILSDRIAAGVRARADKFKNLVEINHINLSVEHVKTLPQAKTILHAAYG